MNTNAKENGKVSRHLHKWLWVVLLVISLSLYMLFAFGLSPLIAYVNSDSTLTFPYLPDLLDLAFNALNLVAFFSCYAITDYCIYRFRMSKSAIVIALFSLATIAKYLFNLIAGFFVFSTVPSSKEDIKKSVASVVINTLVELAQYALVTLIAYCIINKHHKLAAIAQKNADRLGIKYDVRNNVFPFKNLVSVKNPLQRAAIYTSVTVTLIMLVQRFYFVIWSLVTIGGFSGLTDILWTLAGFVGDLLFGVLGYLIMFFVMSKCDTHELKLRVKYGE